MEYIVALFSGDIMNVIDGRGQNQKEAAMVNQKIIKEWFAKNPNSTIKECCDAVNLTYKTVRKHINSIKSESYE